MCLRDETVSSALREAEFVHTAQTENRMQFASFRQTHSYIQFLTLLATAESQRINARSLMSAGVSVSFLALLESIISLGYFFIERRREKHLPWRRHTCIPFHL